MQWKVVSLEGFYFIETDDGVESGCYTHKADAERVCKIKNSHDGLLEALEELVDDILDSRFHEMNRSVILKKAREAIAQAESDDTV